MKPGPVESLWWQILGFLFFASFVTLLIVFPLHMIGLVWGTEYLNKIYTTIEIVCGSVAVTTLMIGVIVKL